MEVGSGSDLEVSIVAVRRSGESHLTLRIRLRGLWRIVSLARNSRLSGRQVRIVCFHLGLLPLAILAAKVSRSLVRPVVFLYGKEIWRRQSLLTRLLVGRAEVLSISSFSAGAALGLSVSGVLEPGVPARRYKALLAGPSERPLRAVVRVLTVFRLGEARAKGASELIQAVEVLRGEGHQIEVTVAGFLDPGASVLPELRAADRLVVSPSEEQLVEEYHRAGRVRLMLPTRYRPNIVRGGVWHSVG